MEIAHQNPSSARILIADDHALFAETLRVYLEKAFTVIATVADGRAMLQEAIRLRPDVIVADISMPLLNGLDAARGIRKQSSHMRFVFLTMHNDANLAAAVLLEFGRVGFVLKNSGGPELLKAIDEIVHGRSYMTPSLRADDWFAARNRARQFSKDLTARQQYLLQLLAEGRTHKEIAVALGLSSKTVEFHKHQITQAFNLKSNADLVLFAVKRGLISVDPEPYVCAPRSGLRPR
jgi:DNA-binding NarL/FixJ family response regulator